MRSNGAGRRQKGTRMRRKREEQREKRHEQERIGSKNDQEGKRAFWSGQTDKKKHRESQGGTSEKGKHGN